MLAKKLPLSLLTILLSFGCYTHAANIQSTPPQSLQTDVVPFTNDPAIDNTKYSDELNASEKKRNAALDKLEQQSKVTPAPKEVQ